MSEAEGVAVATGATVAFEEDGSWQNQADPSGSGEDPGGSSSPDKD